MPVKNSPKKLSLKEQLAVINHLEATKAQWASIPRLDLNALAIRLSKSLAFEITPPNLKHIFEAKGYPLPGKENLSHACEALQSRCDRLEARLERLEKEVGKWQ